jgi:hypothetical protein
MEPEIRSPVTRPQNRTCRSLPQRSGRSLQKKPVARLSQEISFQPPQSVSGVILQYQSHQKPGARSILLKLTRGQRAYFIFAGTAKLPRVFFQLPSSRGLASECRLKISLQQRAQFRGSGDQVASATSGFPAACGCNGAAVYLAPTRQDRTEQ